MSKKYKEGKKWGGGLHVGLEAEKGTFCYKVLTVGRDPIKIFKTEAKAH